MFAPNLGELKACGLFVGAGLKQMASDECYVFKTGDTNMLLAHHFDGAAPVSAVSVLIVLPAAGFSVTQAAALVGLFAASLSLYFPHGPS